MERTDHGQWCESARSDRLRRDQRWPLARVLGRRDETREQRALGDALACGDAEFASGLPVEPPVLARRLAHCKRRYLGALDRDGPDRVAHDAGRGLRALRAGLLRSRRHESRSERPPEPERRLSARRRPGPVHGEAAWPRLPLAADDDAVDQLSDFRHSLGNASAHNVVHGPGRKRKARDWRRDPSGRSGQARVVVGEVPAPVRHPEHHGRSALGHELRLSKERALLGCEQQARRRRERAIAHDRPGRHGRDPARLRARQGRARHRHREKSHPQPLYHYSPRLADDGNADGLPQRGRYERDESVRRRCRRNHLAL